VVSDLAGRANLTTMAEEMGVKADAAQEIETLREIKEAEARGLSYEGAEASVSLLLKRKQSDYVPPFSMIDYQVMVGVRKGVEFVEATVRLQVGDEIMHTAGDGNGPVGALDSALRKALASRFARLSQIQLADYKV